MTTFFATWRAPGAVLVAVAATACITQNPAQPVRFFRPRLLDLPAADGPAAAGQAARRALALDRVTSAPHLGERMVWRLSEVEYAFDDQHRWLAAPEVLVREALERSLGSDGAVRGGENLEVRVDAFERDADQAIVELTLSGSATQPRHIRAVAPLAEDSPAGFAAAMGEALQQAALDTARVLALR